jgi:hypothetical protein
MIMVRAFLLIVCILSGSPLAIAQPINEELVRNIDLTGDGKPGKIVLTLKAKNITKPVQWTLTITSNEKVLLRQSRDDSKIDSFFNDPNYVGNCTGYLECKKRWYYKDILETIVVSRTGYDVEGILDKKDSNTLYSCGRAYLAKCCNITPKRADDILGDVEKRIRSGTAVMIMLPDTPASATGLLMTFCPEVDRFIPVYQE